MLSYLSGIDSRWRRIMTFLEREVGSLMLSDRRRLEDFKPITNSQKQTIFESSFHIPGFGSTIMDFGFDTPQSFVDGM